MFQHTCKALTFTLLL